MRLLLLALILCLTCTVQAQFTVTPMISFGDYIKNVTGDSLLLVFGSDSLWISDSVFQYDGNTAIFNRDSTYEDIVFTFRRHQSGGDSASIIVNKDQSTGFVLNNRLRVYGHIRTSTDSGDVQAGGNVYIGYQGDDLGKALYWRKHVGESYTNHSLYYDWDTTQFEFDDVLSMQGHQIIDVVDPTNDQDAATKKYVDDNAGVGDNWKVDTGTVFDTTTYVLQAGTNMAISMLGDTVILAASLDIGVLDTIINGTDTIYTLAGEGLQVIDHEFRAVLGTMIASDEIIDNTIVSADLDNTTSFTMEDLYANGEVYVNYDYVSGDEDAIIQFYPGGSKKLYYDYGLGLFALTDALYSSGNITSGNHLIATDSGYFPYCYVSSGIRIDAAVNIAAGAINDSSLASRYFLTSDYDGSTLDTNSGGQLKVAADGIGNAQIADDAIGVEHIAQNGATSGQVLKWDGSDWGPENDLQGAGGGLASVEEGDVELDDAVEVMDFGAGFDLTESPDHEINVTLDLSEAPTDSTGIVNGSLPLEELRADNSPADGDLMTYSSTGGYVSYETPAERGLSETGHTHAASDVTSGTFGDARVDNDLTLNSTKDITTTKNLTVSGDSITMGTNTSGHLLVGDGSQYVPKAMSGDVTIDGAGATTVGDDSHNHVIGNIDAFSSSELAGRLSDETGSGSAMFANAPTMEGDLDLDGNNITNVNKISTDSVEGTGSAVALGNDDLYVGDASDDDNVTQYFVAPNDSGGIRYNATTNKVQVSHDLSTWGDIGTQTPSDCDIPVIESGTTREDSLIALWFGLGFDVSLDNDSTKVVLDYTEDPPNLASEVTGTLPVESGGTEVTTLTDGGVLIGNGTDGIVATAVLTNGQILIGDGTTDPSVATITAGEGIDVTNGAGSITLDGEDATTSNKGIASFSSDNFAVGSGEVTIKSGGVDLASEVTGTLPEANGGTGDTDLDDIVAGNGVAVTDGANSVIGGNVTVAADTASIASAETKVATGGGVYTYAESTFVKPGDFTVADSTAGDVDTLGTKIAAALANRIGSILGLLAYLHPDYFDTTAAGDSITLAIATTSAMGVASFEATDFNVSAGAVAIADGAIEDDEVDDNITVNEASDVDTTGAKIAAALASRMNNTGDTVTGTYDHSSGDIEDVDRLTAEHVATDTIIINSDTITDFTGNNLSVSGGQLDVDLTDAVMENPTIYADLMVVGSINKTGYLYQLDAGNMWCDHAPDWLKLQQYNVDWTRPADTTKLITCGCSDSMRIFWKGSDSTWADTSRLYYTRYNIDTGGGPSGNLKWYGTGHAACSTALCDSCKQYGDSCDAITALYYDWDSSQGTPWPTWDAAACTEHYDSLVYCDSTTYWTHSTEYALGEGADSANWVHPDILVYPKGLWGIDTCKILITGTPFCTGQDDENNHALGSNDGINFHKIVDTLGDSLFNPMLEPEYFAADHLSDPDWFYDKEGTIYASTRVTWGTTDSTAIYVISTTDGQTWTDTTRVAKRNGSGLMSQAFVLAPNGQYHMYCIENEDSLGAYIWYTRYGDIDGSDTTYYDGLGQDRCAACSTAIWTDSCDGGCEFTEPASVQRHISYVTAGNGDDIDFSHATCDGCDTLWDSVSYGGFPEMDTNRVVRYVSDYPDSMYVFDDTVNCWTTCPDSFKLWHMNVIPSGADEMVMLITETPLGADGDSSRLALAVSHDNGDNWGTARTPLLLNGYDMGLDSTYWYFHNIYRAAGYWAYEGGERVLVLYYSANSGWKDGALAVQTNWHIGRTIVHFGPRPLEHDTATHAIEVYDAALDDSILYQAIQVIQAQIAQPDGLDDTMQTMFTFDSYLYPYGVEIVYLSASLADSTGASYSCRVSEWAGLVHPAHSAWIDTLTITSDSAFTSSTTFYHHLIEAGHQLRVHYPTTDVPSIHYTCGFYTKGSD